MARRPVVAAQGGVGACRWAIVAFMVVMTFMACLGFAPALRADEAPKPPQTLLTVPLSVIVGAPVKVRARGLRLEGVTEVRSMTPGVTVTLLSQGKVGLPTGVPAEKAGDTQVEFEIRFSADLPVPPPTEMAIVLVAPHGETPLCLPLLEPDRGLVEVEPNPGFDKAHILSLPAVAPLSILGAIERPLDVDVFRLAGKAGEHLRVSVTAHSLGSLLDPLLTLHDSDGAPIATADDGEGSRDPQLGITVLRTGPIFLVVQDANDAGSEAHPYRVTVESSAPVEPVAAVSFIRDIAPILQRRCVACHGENKAEGEWRADSLAALIKAGASGAESFLAGHRATSEAFVRITSTDADLRMPLDGEPLSNLEVDTIARWIDAGLPFDGVSADTLLVDQIPPPTHPAAPPTYATLPPVTALAFTPSGDLLVGGWREVLVVDPASGGVRSRIGNLPERSSRIALHPLGDRFAVAGGMPGRLGEVRLFTLAGELLGVLAPGADIVHDVAWSADGSRLAVASSDATVRVFDAKTGKLIRSIDGHRDWVLAVAWSPDGSRIATGSRDRTAKVFDSTSGALLATYSRHDAPVRGILFHPEGEEMLSVSDAQKWDRWKIAAAAHVRDTHLGGEVFQVVAAGEFFVAPSANGKAHLFKLQDGEKVREYDPGAGRRLISVAASVPADLVAAGTQDGRVVVWKLSTGERLADFPLQP
ncbi:MAG: hypothetical protein NT171_02115 [Planctomycetota bacterium]|nr:hypothetical protein [Planctomycetota bacterium]